MSQVSASEDVPTSEIQLAMPTILDDRASVLFRLRLDRVLAGSPDTVTLDCSPVRFVDSGGLRLLMEATRTGHDFGTRVVTYDPLGALDHLRRIVDLGSELIIDEGPRTDPV
jgi:anti-anti-sigma regulatory factor